jgi:hypothetical protein
MTGAEPEISAAGRRKALLLPLLVAAMVYLFVTLGIGLLLGSLNLPKYRHLAGEGQPVTATVEATDCGNHASYSYRFTVGGRRYTGSGGPGFGTPACGELHPGDRVVAYYLPSDPTTSVPGDIHQRLRNEKISVWSAAIGLPLFGILGVWLRSWLRERWRHDDRVCLRRDGA